MTECEKIELAIRRVLSHIKIQPYETGVEEALQLLAEQIAADEKERRIDGEQVTDK